MPWGGLLDHDDHRLGPRAVRLDRWIVERPFNVLGPEGWWREAFSIRLAPPAARPWSPPERLPDEAHVEQLGGLGCLVGRDDPGDDLRLHEALDAGFVRHTIPGQGGIVVLQAQHVRFDVVASHLTREPLG